MVPATPRLPWYSFRWKTIGWIFFWTLLTYSLVVLGLLRFGRNPRISLRSLLVAATLVGLIGGYVGTYLYLSQRGMQEATAVGLNGFFYVPFSEAEATHDVTKHHRIINPVKDWLREGRRTCRTYERARFAF